MKKILIFANDSGGLYHFRRDLITELLKENQVFVSVPATNEYETLKKMGCKLLEAKVDRRGTNPLKDINLVFEYIRVVRTVNPDFVITYTIKPNIYGGMVCRLKKIPYFSNVTGLGTTFQNEDVLKKFVVLLCKLGMKSAEKVFFENSANRDIFIKEGIVEESQTVVLNGAGVNLQHFPYEEYPPIDEVTKFVFIGRVMKEKGVDELLSAAEFLWRSGEKIQIEIVGRSEEDYKNKLSLGIEAGWLKYHGFQSDVRPFIKNAHCSVLPSWHEGMANTNLESAAMGRPVITSNIPGCREAIVNQTSGFLCEPRDSQSLINAMKLFIDSTDEEKKRMGVEARAHMEKHFDKRKVVCDTINNFQSVL